MTKALLVIDYSNDFIANEGALSCGVSGQVLDDAIVIQIEAALTANDFVFVCNDEHDASDSYDPEAALFPPHNLAGSWGRRFLAKQVSL